jgi:hypothetical protein
LNDPLTIEWVTPQNLSDSFGDGVSLKEVTLEIVDEPVTRKIENILPWLVSLNGKYLPYNGLPKDSPTRRLSLHGGHFSRDRNPSICVTYNDACMNKKEKSRSAKCVVLDSICKFKKKYKE